MKRTLLATSALCMGAGTAMAMDQGMADGMGTGMAMAQSQTIVMGDPKGSGKIVIEGEAEMGVAGSKDDSVRFHNDVNMKFALSGTTHSGVTFGTEIELSDIENAAGKKTTDDDDEHGGIFAYIKDPEGFGNLTLGDTDGAFDWAMEEVNSGGLRSDSEHKAWNGNSGLDGVYGAYDGQILRYDRAIGSGFSFAASLELDDDTDKMEGGDTGDPVFGIGGRYKMDMNAGKLAVGGGYQMVSYDYESDDELYGIGLPGEFEVGLDAQIFGGSAKMEFVNGLSAVLNASVGELDASGEVRTGGDTFVDTLDGEMTHVGLGVAYKIGDVSLGVNVGRLDEEVTYDPSNGASNDRLMGDETTTGVGFDASYNLGGGASLMFGVGNSETEYDFTREADGTNPADTDDSVMMDSNTDTYKWSLGLKFAF